MTGFGRRIRELRERLGATQAGLAKRLGVDRVTVARWETGARQPRSRWLLERIERVERSLTAATGAGADLNNRTGAGTSPAGGKNAHNNTGGEL